MLFDPLLPRRVLERRQVAPDAFVLRVERRGDNVKAGRHINVALPGGVSRAYSVFSGENDPWLEILVRRVEKGEVSPQLGVLEAGDQVRVEPAKGKFTLAGVHPFERLLFVSTGTGVAPFRSFIRSHPGLDFLLVHGIRRPDDDFAREFCPPDQLVTCVSSPTGGRVTTWLKQADLGAFDRAFLCGNSNMIAEAVRILVDSGLEEAHIHTETYS